MRTARVVGLSPDGTSLIVATQSGEELAVVVDEKLRAAMRGDRPRLGQLEIEMESSLTPREIQARIRAGETLEDVARVAGLPMDRVERFAAPVLAEREHVAAMAMTSSVRRRGETSGHRNLRVAVTERLLARGVDVDTLTWDAYRLENGRWTVIAHYRSGEAERAASFVFDQQGRFSVAADDGARWLLGEQASTQGPQPGRRRTAAGIDDPDSEPTIDLSDELALVRVVQDEPDAPLAVVRTLRPVEPVAAVATSEAPAAPAESANGEADDEVSYDAGDVSDGAAAAAEADDEAPSFDAGEVAETTLGAGAVADGGRDTDAESEEDEPAERSQLDTLYDMLGGVDYAEDSAQAYAGLDELPSRTAEPPTARADEDEDGDKSDEDDAAYAAQAADEEDGGSRTGPGSDAIAVPDVSNAGWEPAIVVDYPVEPSQLDDAEPLEEPARPEPPVAIEDREDEAEELIEESEGFSPPLPSMPDVPGQPEATKPIARRKRASVPSWDEIMFGGPKRP